jgi:hypothetical protein
MATIDLTLNSFIVPGMASLTPLWGTVQTDPDHPGLSAMESIWDMMMPFNRMRPVVVTEDSATTEVQADTEPSAGFISDWKSYRHDIWNLNTNGIVATTGTKEYSRPDGYACVERKALQASWTDADFTEGAQISGGAHSGKYIWQVIAFAGLFFGAEDSGYEDGGKRPPPLIAGGVQKDRIRDIQGNSGRLPLTQHEGGHSGAISTSPVAGTGASTNPVNNTSISFKASRVVSTGADNAPTNISTRFWRRVA